jgi:uncharacterized protein (DUF1778 family)
MTAEHGPQPDKVNKKARGTRREGDPNTVVFTLRMSPQEKTVFEAFAAMQNQSLSEFFRDAATHRVRGIVEQAGGFNPFLEQADAAERQRAAEAHQRIAALRDFFTTDGPSADTSTD